MKKCTAIIFYSALFFLFSCGVDRKEESVQTQQAPAKENCLTIDTIKVHERYTFAYTKENVPTLAIDIELPHFKLENKSATARLDSILAWGLFLSSSPTLQAACDDFVTAQKELFNEFRNEYHNLNEGEIPPGMMNNYVNVKVQTSVGHKGYINYIMTREEYHGGAHPSTLSNIVCFDPATGTEITLNDIFKEGYEDTLLLKLTNQLMENENVSTIRELCDKGYFLSDIDMHITNNFILKQDSITFLYNRYEIAPYALGDILISLDYETLKDIIK